jgi:hypothetical protein
MPCTIVINFAIFTLRNGIFLKFQDFPPQKFCSWGEKKMFLENCNISEINKISVKDAAKLLWC